KKSMVDIYPDLQCFHFYANILLTVVVDSLSFTAHCKSNYDSCCLGGNRQKFWKNTNTDTFFCLITLGFYLYYINYVDEVTYIENRDLHPKTAAGDWVSSILFAVVAATIVHTYFIQPFTIPTSSLEKILLVGDFLFVSKM